MIQLADVVQLFSSHKTEIGELAGVAAGFLGRHLWPKVEAEESKLEGLTFNAQNPTIRALALKADELIEQAIPGAGDARYSAYAALIVHEDPVLEPLQGEIAKGLEALCVSVKNAAAAEASKSPAAPGAPAPIQTPQA